MNIVLLVIDSLRCGSLNDGGESGPRTPFMRWLATKSMSFSRAYATECWTLPTHCSIFTGLLPSEHVAHFQTMGYTASAPTVAEISAARGYDTEVVTRNFVFDGTIPGITRGFRRNRRLLSEASRVNPFALFLALAKPRFRRHIKSTGFFHPLHKDNREFMRTFALSLMPADERVLDYAIDFMARHRRQSRPFFLFCNLYDVHAPYPPTRRSILRSFRSSSGCVENFRFPQVMATLGGHAYLRSGFRISEGSRRTLLARYHRAIELMDAKLADFWHTADESGLLDDTLLIVTSDHGEAFGEHDLYLHDASVYETHLHVPLWIHHPDRSPEIVDDVVSTRDLFGLIRSATLGQCVEGTILDPSYRSQHPIALAEHFYYPHCPDMQARYRQNLAAAVTRDAKMIVRGTTVERYDLAHDPHELAPEIGDLREFATSCARDEIPSDALNVALAHLRQYQQSAVH